LVLVTQTNVYFGASHGNSRREAITLSVVGYSSSIAGLGNLSIRDTATTSAGNATAAIQNEFQGTK
jgi:hypothetical protein